MKQAENENRYKKKTSIMQLPNRHEKLDTFQKEVNMNVSQGKYMERGVTIHL